ncbi:MAG: aminopeptidase [Methanobacteriota archaeon]|nr:MAG: aminopeptidase [Euryarchaeota archaeon]
MKVFISIDMEGICGVVSEIETDPIKGGEAYQRNRHLMTQEANAAVEGCVKAGATEVLIADSHWNFDNLLPEELHEAAMLLRGTPRSFSMVQDLDSSYDAALFIGYHARAGTPRAILDHTYSGTIASVRVNDTEVGETGINAYKDATGATAARNLHPKKAREQIRTEAAKALREAKTIAPLRAKMPIRMVVEFRGTYAADRAAMIPTVRRIAGLHFEFEAADYPEAFRTFYAMVTIAGGD